MASWPGDRDKINALTALHELTKYPQNIFQIHSDAVVRRLLGYLMEKYVHTAQRAAGTLRNLRYLAMSNMSNNCNFEDVYFPLRSEERQAIERIKREMITKRLVPGAKAEADKLKRQGETYVLNSV